MFVNRRKIRIGSVTGDSINFNIPIKMNADPLDNEDLVKSTFVEEEVEKAINQTIDLKKVRFKPATVKNGRWTIVPEIKIELKFFKSDGTYSNEYASLGFTTPDLFCRVNRVMKSFLSLDYYNSTNSAENIFLTNSDVYTQIGDDQTNEIGIPLKANFNPISYRLGDPTLRPNEVHEGFHIFWFSNDILTAENQEYVMYLSPTYQNAGDGTVSIMTPVKGSFNTDGLSVFGLGGDNGTQYIKVILKYRESTGDFMYTISHNNERQLKSNNPDGGIDWNNDTVGHIPTLTLYQLQPTNTTNFSDVAPSSDTSTENTDDSRGDRIVVTENINTVPIMGNTTQNTNGSNVLLKGSVSGDGGANITERGFVYSTVQSPTISSGNKKTINGGLGSMSTTLNDLVEGIYYARAFATNSVGTSYSNEEVLNIVVVDTTTDDDTGGGWGAGGATTDNLNLGNTNNNAGRMATLVMEYRKSQSTSSWTKINNGDTISYARNQAIKIRGILKVDGEEDDTLNYKFVSSEYPREDLVGSIFINREEITFTNSGGGNVIFAPESNPNYNIEFELKY